MGRGPLKYSSPSGSLPQNGSTSVHLTDSGPITERAYQEFSLRTAAITKELGAFDTRSEQNICTLSLRAQRLCRIFLTRVLQGGMRVRVISGTRTYKEQDELFRRGRYGNPGPRVTNARGGRSNHNFGIAWDIGIFTAEGGYVTGRDDYDEAARIGLTPDIEWGGTGKASPTDPTTSSVSARKSA